MPAAYLKAPGFSLMRRIERCRKVAFESRAAASSALKRLNLAGANGMRVYRCEFCPGEVWHHGHPGETTDRRLLRAARAARQPSQAGLVGDQP